MDAHKTTCLFLQMTLMSSRKVAIVKYSIETRYIRLHKRQRGSFEATWFLDQCKAEMIVFLLLSVQKRKEHSHHSCF